MLKTENLIKTKWGFYEFENMPSEQELAEFYSQVYYQKEVSLYKLSYSAEELKHFEFINRLVSHKIQELNPKAKTMVDVGCGEGFLLKEFKKQGFDVKGFDYSADGIQRLNIDMEPFFEQGNIFKTVENEFKNNKYDVVTNMSVMEHVSDAHRLIDLLKSGMNEDSILVVKVPNDFSSLHEKLLKEKRIPKQGWVSYPQHLRYFNKESFTNFANDKGFDVVSIIADYPRDMFLLTKEFNYYNDSKKGHSAYEFNLEHDLFMADMEIEKVIKLYETYAELGLGRSLTYFCKLKKE